MTISNQTNRISYNGNGTTTVFSFPATLLATADLDVKILVVATGVESASKIEITDYTIALAGDFSTATVTMVVAPAIGERLVLNREQDYLQGTDLINDDGVPADTVELMSDRRALAEQRLQEQQDRSITVPVTSNLTGIEVEDFNTKAGQLLRINSTEDGISLVEIDLEVITQNQVTQLQKDIYNQIIDLTNADSPYTVLADDEGALYRCDTSTGAITINLPSMAAQTEDLKYSIVKQSGDANLVTITASGSELISGLASRTIGTRYAMMVVVGDVDNQEWFHQGTTQSLADINLDVFSGNDSDVEFTLTVDPISENNTWVTVDGVSQQKSTYTVVGTTLTFSTAPPAGTNNIDVIYIETLAIGVPADNSVSTVKIVTSAVTLAKMADLAQNTFIGRITASTGVPEALTVANMKTMYESNADTNEFSDAEQTKLSGIETSADVTDAANVNTAGAVMETDYNAQTVLLAVADDTPLPVTMGASTFVGRKATGDAVAMSAVEANVVLQRPEMLPFALGDELTLQTTGLKLTWRIRQAFELTAIFGELTTAATDATFIMDVHLNGTTIMTTDKVDILTGATDDDGNAALTTTTLAVDDLLEFYVDQIGSTLAGKGPKINMIGYQL